MLEEVIEITGKVIFVKQKRFSENKPTLVFLHDSLGCTQLWRDFPEKLSEETGCNILSYDRWGYGKSFPMDTHHRENHYMELEADFLNDLLLKLNINDAILFGHSDGGTIALIAAAKYPKKINAVICEVGHIFVEDITVNGIKQALHAYENTNLPERLEKYHGNKVETIVNAWTEIWLSEKFGSWNIECLLKDITCPLLFIHGEHDEYGTLKQVEKTVSQVKGSAEKFIIPNTGHTPHKESPEIVLKKSSEFINSIVAEE